ncbi:hypothetical protein J7E87_14520 [Streptomyces sp. ISL-1]|uniref:hypothetical protein n=1 Tax=Streptomyces sp. ISL-1 TaxID=2817657 RepID=UPI001BE675E4|nr:hypothetical protein [Streptomyces sp. ISL-1]MBT2390612.1 hypothetical protein [Streptomyces sp. ISL-1]
MGDENIAVAQIVEKSRGNVLLAVFSALLGAGDAVEVEKLKLDDPIFLAETMDLRLKEGVWRVLGNREISSAIPVPAYKVWVEPPGEYRRQDIHGKVGEVISPEEAATLKLQKSFSPAVIETALRGLHGLGPWRAAFDEL